MQKAIEKDIKRKFKPAAAPSVRVAKNSTCLLKESRKSEEAIIGGGERAKETYT
jgi:hypothetical protein